MDKTKLEFLTTKARKIRDDVIEIIGHFGSGHIGGAMSVVDALTVIYYDKANVDFPNDWANKVDYIRQELGLEWPETIADVYIKGNKLYGLQTREKGEPYEVELYNLK